MRGLTLEPLEDRRLMTVSTFSQDVLAAAPVAFWPLNDASTASGAVAVSLIDPSVYNGTYQSGNQAGNGVTSGAAAYPALGNAAYFHNTTANTSLAASDAVITPNLGLPAGATDRTVLFWAKDNDTSADSRYHAATEYGSPGTLTSGYGTFVFAAGDTNSPVGGMAISPWGGGSGTTTAFDDGQWHFFAVTTSGGGTPTYKVYADGVLQNSTTITTNTILGLANSIGSSASVDGSSIVGWNGGLGDVAIFNSALSASQIAQMYADAPNSAALTVSQSTSGILRRGDTGDQLVLTVSNPSGTATTGTITITDTLPTGLTPTAASGSGWTTSIAGQTVTATRGDSLAGGATLPALSILFDVAADAPASVVNTGTVTDDGGAVESGSFSFTSSISRALATFTQDVLAAGPVAFWPLNDASMANGSTAASLVSPSTYNGTYQAGNQAGDGVTSGAAAYPALGNAAYFHNTTANTSLAASDAVITPNVGLPVAATDRTVLFWAKDNNTSADSHYHAATEYGSPGTLTSGYGTFVFAAGDTNSPVGGMAISPWGGGTGTATAFDDGQWHFFAVTTSGGGTPTYKVYADGVLQNSTTITTNTILGLANAIGASASVDGSSIVGWNGGLGDVAIFDQALSATKISELFADATNGPVLKVASSQSPGAFQPSDINDQYQVSVTNVGNLPSSGPITLTEQLPAGVTLRDVPTGTGWTTLAAAGASTFTATYNGDPLAAGGVATLIVPVTVASTGPFDANEVTLSGGEGSVVDARGHVQSLAAPAMSALGHNITLTAQGVSNYGGIANVSFYADTNQNGVLDVADTPLGTASGESDGARSLSFNSSVLGVGTRTFFAQSSLGGNVAMAQTLVGIEGPIQRIGVTTADMGSTLILTAKGLFNAGGVTGVSYYLDSNGNGAIDAGIDQLLGTATSGADWNLAVSTNDLPNGSIALLAQAQLTGGATGPVTAQNAVNLALYSVSLTSTSMQLTGATADSDSGSAAYRDPNITVIRAQSAADAIFQLIHFTATNSTTGHDYDSDVESGAFVYNPAFSYEVRPGDRGYVPGGNNGPFSVGSAVSFQDLYGVSTNEPDDGYFQVQATRISPLVSVDRAISNTNPVLQLDSDTLLQLETMNVHVEIPPGQDGSGYYLTISVADGVHVWADPYRTISVDPTASIDIIGSSFDNTYYVDAVGLGGEFTFTAHLMKRSTDPFVADPNVGEGSNKFKLLTPIDLKTLFQVQLPEVAANAVTSQARRALDPVAEQIKAAINERINSLPAGNDLAYSNYQAALAEVDLVETDSLSRLADFSRYFFMHTISGNAPEELVSGEARPFSSILKSTLAASLNRNTEAPPIAFQADVRSTSIILGALDEALEAAKNGNRQPLRDLIVRPENVIQAFSLTYNLSVLDGFVPITFGISNFISSSQWDTNTYKVKFLFPKDTYSILRADAFIEASFTPMSPSTHKPESTISTFFSFGRE